MCRDRRVSADWPTRDIEEQGTVGEMRKWREEAEPEPVGVGGEEGRSQSVPGRPVVKARW
jgi:hypothetical protein